MMSSAGPTSSTGTAMFVGQRKVPRLLTRETRNVTEAPKRILAATDLLSGSRHVLGRAAALVELSGGALDVIHVLALENNAGDGGSAEKRANEALSREADTISAKISAPGTHVARGIPGPVVAAEGARLEADLFVAGFHREVPASPKRLGSTMTHLLVETDTDVLLVKDQPSPTYRSVVIAWDGDKDLGRAISVAKAYAPSADLSIFMSVPLARELARGEDALRDAVSAAGYSPADISLHVSSDGLMEGLRDTLREEMADLLVLPTRGSQAGDLGFVASEILSQRLCDTLCLRQPH